MDLALKNKLNSEIVDVIQQHHGTSLVSYFYQRALQQQSDARLGGKIMKMRPEDIPEVKEESFRYPGPKPQTKETAIVSLADAVESASRSMERPTPQRIEDLINSLIDVRIAEHQLDEAPLTLAEIRKIAESFRFTLINMLHSRIAYPQSGRKKIRPHPRSAANKNRPRNRVAPVRARLSLARGVTPLFFADRFAIVAALVVVRNRQRRVGFDLTFVRSMAECALPACLRAIRSGRAPLAGLEEIEATIVE